MKSVVVLLNDTRRTFISLDQEFHFGPVSLLRLRFVLSFRTHLVLHDAGCELVVTTPLNGNAIYRGCSVLIMTQFLLADGG